MTSGGKLIRESEWMRVFESADRSRTHKSKFLTGDIEVSAQSIMTRWPNFSYEEKLEFANAFAVKPQVTPEDERILDFLMAEGDFYVWMTIASLLPRHRNRERVLAFLEKRVREGHADKANFFQALELMADKRALPTLRAAYNAYKIELHAPFGPPSGFDYLDYLTCCRALWVVDGSPEYKQAIEALAKHEDTQISALARRILGGI